MASLALRGVETGSAVIERDFSGEVRILVRNHGPQDYVIEPEEAVAQLVLEKVFLAKIKEVKELDGPVKKQKEEVCPSVRSLVVETAGASSGRSSMKWMKPEMKGFEKVGEGLRLRKAAPAGGGDDPPEVAERPSQDEPGEDEWEVEFLENEIRLSRIHMVPRYWDYIPRPRELPPGINFEDLDYIRISEIAPEEENGMAWERVVENWREHWERRTPTGSSNFRVLRRPEAGERGSSSIGPGQGPPKKRRWCWIWVKAFGIFGRGFGEIRSYENGRIGDIGIYRRWRRWHGRGGEQAA